MDPLRHAVVLTVDGLPVPVLTPQYLYRAYMHLGRAERAALRRPLLAAPHRPGALPGKTATPVSAG